MQFEYSEWDGSQKFTPASAESAFDRISDYILEHGEYVLRQLERNDDEDLNEVLKMLLKEGYLEKDEKGRFVIAPKGVKRIEHKALELNEIAARTRSASIPTTSRGRSRSSTTTSKPCEFFPIPMAISTCTRR